MHRAILVKNVGTISYKHGLDMQRTLAAQLRNKQLAPKDPNFQHARNTLILLQHNPPVYTMGIKDSSKDFRKSEEEILKTGCEIYKTSRGGKITWHGTGQLVGYPIVDLHDFKKDLRWYVHNVENVLVRTLEHFGIKSNTTSDVGVWIEGKRKIAAIGVQASRWVTTHGFALNINNDLSYFDNIIPCGIEDKEVTSLSKELNRRVELEEVIPIITESFAKVFDCKMEFEPSVPQKVRDAFKQDRNKNVQTVYF